MAGTGKSVLLMLIQEFLTARHGPGAVLTLAMYGAAAVLVVF